ncbi:uncharacterized protein LOC128129256 [Lactuca sativa]|uniref:uncharacterized protein LOC128129256 n=1 Tax=Lactuca sativa TaxID=4236 RepID=UPI0022AF4BE3|nr:uncharacterized protein LOC128129256 [Lactuca sativa]
MKLINSSHSQDDLPPPPLVLHRLRPRTLSPLSGTSRFALSATVISAAAILAASSVIIFDDSEIKEEQAKKKRLLDDFEHAIDRSKESFKRVVNTMKHTGVAASVLWKSLRSVLSSANHEVWSGFEVRVAALLADIVAANESRRAAIVGAGGGVVLDWLLESVALSGGGNYGTQAESARALAYLIADPNVSEAVLGRPHAIPNLLRFIFFAQPHQSKKHPRRSSFNISDPSKGRSMLVAAIMDIVTSNCDNVDKIKLKPMLSGTAAMRDIAAALEVIEEGGMHMDEPPGSSQDDDDGTGLKGIGMEVLGGTSIVGLSTSNRSMELDESKATHNSSSFNKLNNTSSVNTTVIPGLWDDLHSQHVAVPFVAWALANWAMASDVNRSHIQELDFNGHAVMSALIAPERSVKFHGSLVAQLLLKDENLPRGNLVKNTVGVVFYSCPHFGSKLADMPWRMGYVFRPAPSIGELRSGSTRLVELNDFLHELHKKGSLDVLSFCETKVTPIVEGYGGWAFRLEIVPIESAYPGYGELVQSYARATLLNIFCNDDDDGNSGSKTKNHGCARYGETVFLINPGMSHWECSGKGRNNDSEGGLESPSLDVIFVHGLRGGPYKTWRLSEDKSSSKSGLVEKIDEEAGKHGTFSPGEWLSTDFPHARLFSLKYKTNLTQWSGSSLPLQEVSSMLLEKLIAARIGDRPVVFVTHSMGGLVVKQMLHQASAENRGNLVKNSVGVLQDMSIGTSWNI